MSLGFRISFGFRGSSSSEYLGVAETPPAFGLQSISGLQRTQWFRVSMVCLYSIPGVQRSLRLLANPRGVEYLG